MSRCSCHLRSDGTKSVIGTAGCPKHGLVAVMEDREKLRATMVRCAEKLETVGNQEPAAVASMLRDVAHHHGGLAT